LESQLGNLCTVFKPIVLYLVLRCVMSRLRGTLACQMLILLEQLTSVFERFNLYEEITNEVRLWIGRVGSACVGFGCESVCGMLSLNESQSPSSGSGVLTYDCLASATEVELEVGDYWSSVGLLDMELFGGDPGRPTSVRKVGGSSHWRAVKCSGVLEGGVHRVSVVVESDPVSSNAWRTVIGVVPVGFECGARCVGGSRGGWGLVCGLGRKYHGGCSEGYSAVRVKQGDVVTLVLDMEAHTLAYEVNGEYLGEAYCNLPRQVQVGVSLTGIGAVLTLRY
jgi:hypothetical protein